MSKAKKAVRSIRGLVRSVRRRLSSGPAPEAGAAPPGPAAPPKESPPPKSGPPSAATVDHETALKFFEKRKAGYQRLSAAVAPYVDRHGVIFDVGANIGYFSLILAEELEFVGKAHLFEPVPHLASLCRKTLADVSFEWELHEYGLSDEDAELDIFIAADGNLGWNTMIAEKASAAMKRVAIAVKAFEGAGIDEQPSFIKIDVEGAEYKVLRGMLGALEGWSPRPVILCEVGWGQGHPSWEEELSVFRELEAVGYEICGIDGTAIHVTDITKTTDILFLPRES